MESILAFWPVVVGRRGGVGCNFPAWCWVYLDAGRLSGKQFWGCGHAISLLRWRSGGVNHPHDMPPSRFPPSPTFGDSSPPEGIRAAVVLAHSGVEPFDDRSVAQLHFVACQNGLAHGPGRTPQSRRRRRRETGSRRDVTLPAQGSGRARPGTRAIAAASTREAPSRPGARRSRSLHFTPNLAGSSLA